MSFFKNVSPRMIFVNGGKYSPPSDEKYFDDKNPFFPELSLSSGDGYIHVWKIDNQYVYAVEIYPLHFRDYPNDMNSVGVQHVTPITEEEFLKYKSLPLRGY